MKKSVRIGIVLMFALSLTACGSGRTVTSKRKTVSSETTSAASESAEVNTEETAPSPESLEPGAVLPSETTASSLYDEAYAEEYRPYFCHLDENQKLFYLQAVEDLQNLVQERDIKVYGLDKDRLDGVMTAIYYEHPEIFWYGQRSGDGTTNNYTSWVDSAGNCSKVTYVYNDLANDLTASRQAVEDQAAAILSPVSGQDACAVEKYVHDYLTGNTAYAFNDHDQDIYSALVLHQTVCAGFARSFQYLMMKAGIPCYFVYGSATNSAGTAMHAWNVVKLNNEYYEIDVTWDQYNSTPVTLYTYYNVTTSEISADHARSELSAAVPTASGYVCSFENQYHITRQLASTENIYGCTTVVNSLDEYIALHTQVCNASADGSAEFCYIANGEEVYQQIRTYIQGRSYDGTYLAGKPVSIRWNTGSCYSGIYYVDQIQEP